MQLNEVAQTATPIPVNDPEIRTKILRLQGILESLPDDKKFTDLPLQHRFADSAYARTILLPKGTLVIGKIHKHSHMNFVTSGLVSVVTEEGTKQIYAPSIFVSAPGTKRVVYAHEDSVWTTVHVTQETDLEKIEEEIIAKTFDDLPWIKEAEEVETIEEKAS